MYLSQSLYSCTSLSVPLSETSALSGAEVERISWLWDDMKGGGPRKQQAAAVTWHESQVLLLLLPPRLSPPPPPPFPSLPANNWGNSQLCVPHTVHERNIDRTYWDSPTPAAS